AALLERGGELQVLELQPDVGPGDARQRLAAQAGRVHDRALDAVGRPAAVLQGDRQIGHGGVHAGSRRSVPSAGRDQGPTMGRNHGSPWYSAWSGKSRPSSGLIGSLRPPAIFLAVWVPR